MIDRLSLGVYDCSYLMLTSLSVNEILLSRDVKWFSNFRGFPLKVEMASSGLKHMEFVSSTFTLKPMPLAVSFSWDSDWAGEFVRSARSSV